MAKKVVILSEIVKIVEDKVGKKQQVLKTKIKNDVSPVNDVIFIFDADTNFVPWLSWDGEEMDSNIADNSIVHTILSGCEVFDYAMPEPYLWAKGALNGLLTIDGVAVTEEDLLGHTFIID